MMTLPETELTRLLHSLTMRPSSTLSRLKTGSSSILLLYMVSIS